MKTLDGQPHEQARLQWIKNFILLVELGNYGHIMRPAVVSSLRSSFNCNVVWSLDCYGTPCSSFPVKIWFTLKSILWVLLFLGPHWLILNKIIYPKWKGLMYTVGAVDERLFLCPTRRSNPLTCSWKPHKTVNFPNL